MSLLAPDFDFAELTAARVHVAAGPCRSFCAVSRFEKCCAAHCKRHGTSDASVFAHAGHGDMCSQNSDAIAAARFYASLKVEDARHPALALIRVSVM